MILFIRVFCVYLLALACLPCSDGEHGHEIQTVDRGWSLSTDGHSNQEHEDCEDLCSPFCICSCCSTHSFSVKLVPMGIKFTTMGPKQGLIYYQGTVSTDFLKALLRPPISQLG